MGGEREVVGLDTKLEGMRDLVTVEHEQQSRPVGDPQPPVGGEQ
jgi:hypothetical protein